MQSIESYQDIINSEIEQQLQQADFNEPHQLYAPCKYILKNGGKRVRASLVLLACNMFAKSYTKALPVALAFETFHNFTLIHDDIMDSADIRRGQPTVHKKWDTNTAILSGDAVMIMAYRFFEQADEFVGRLFSLLNTTALQVCEGQQYDVILEQARITDAEVTEKNYLQMIELKTSVLIAACLKAGAIVGGASIEEANKLYEVGRLIGIAFQLQDDLLDAYGNDAFGKKIGGDILENKKTFLAIKALELLDTDNAEKLIQHFSQSQIETDKIKQVLELYNKAEVKKITESKVADYFTQALHIVKSIQIDEADKTELVTFIQELQKRKQ